MKACDRAPECCVHESHHSGALSQAFMLNYLLILQPFFLQAMTQYVLHRSITSGGCRLSQNAQKQLAVLLTCAD